MSKNTKNMSLEEALAYIKSLESKVSELEQKNANLTELIIRNQKKMFGKSSEQIQYMDGAEQLSLFNEAEQEYSASAPEPTKETLVKAHPRKVKRTKAEITEKLKHVEQICDLEDKHCLECGAELVCIGKEFVRSELNIIPAQIFVVDIYRKVYKCTNCADDEYTPIFKAEAPVPVMKKSMATPATVAYVMQQKYQLGMPLNRQEQYWKSEGVELSRTTLANWIIRSSMWFEKLWERMLALLLQDYLIHADESPLRVLKRNGQQVDGQSRMWVFCSGKYSEHKMALYYNHATRSGKVVEKILGDYSKYLQTDGCASYNAAEKAIHIGCWAHARRKWTDCLPKGIDDKNSKAAQALALIERIFAADKGFEGLPENENRIKVIQPLLDEYWKLLETIDTPKGSGIYKAVLYSINQKKQLNNVLLDSRIELTNNLAERAIKPFVVGRKNWLFSDTDKGADASARCYSIIESAKANNLNVFGYLTHLLTELPKLGMEPTTEQLDELLPWATTLPDYCRMEK